MGKRANPKVYFARTKPRSEKTTNKWIFAKYIGFFAGLIWGALKIVEHYFHFTTLTPGFLIEPFYKHSFLMTWQGYIVGWLFFTLFSILASLLYAALYAKKPGPYYGLGYGLVWWALLYLLIGPLTGMMNWIGYMDLNTVLTDVCLFVLWGLFIGYSISFEFTDERSREPDELQKNKKQRRLKSTGTV